MAKTMFGVPLSEVRLALIDRLRSPDEFDAFCVTHFPEVYDQFTVEMDREERVSVLLAEVSSDVVWDALQGDAATVEALQAKNPYRGLAVFEIEHAERFFGRAALIADLRGRLAAMLQSPSQPRLLPLIGPVGCGKSSLLRAGLLGSLLRSAGDGLPQLPRTRVVLCEPGERPLRSLAMALQAQVDPKASVDGLEAELRQPGGLVAILVRCAKAQGAGGPLWAIAVDQFEELYTQCRVAKEGELFVARLLEAATAPVPGASGPDAAAALPVVLLAMRSDYLDVDKSHAALSRVLASDGINVPKMDRAQLAAAIIEPAQRAGHPLPLLFVEEVLHQAGANHDSLPLVQFALRRLWVELASGQDALASLRRVGGISGALADWGNSLYKALANDSERRRAQRIFLSLLCVVEPSPQTTRDKRAPEGLDALRQARADARARATGDAAARSSDRPLARRRRRLIDLIPAGSDDEATRRILRHFGRAQDGHGLDGLLAVDDRDTVQLLHETLITSWGMLGSWLQSEGDLVRLLHRLDTTVEAWRDAGRPTRLLWRGPDLQKLRELRLQSEPVLNRASDEFLQACERRERGLLSERAARASSRGWLALGLSVLVAALIGCLLLFLSWGAGQQRAKNLAKSSSAAALAPQPGLGVKALLLAMQATQDSQHIGPLWEGLYQVSMVLLPSRLLGQGDRDGVPSKAVLQAQSGIRSIAFAPDGNHLLAGNQDGTLSIWDLRGNLGDTTTTPFGARSNPRVLSGHKHAKAVQFVGYARLGEAILSAGDDRTAVLWDAKSEAPQGHVAWPARSEGKREGERGIYALELSPDGTTLLTAGADPVVRVYDVEDNQLIFSLPHADTVFAARFSPSGNRIVTACRDQLVRIFDTETGVLLRAIGPSAYADSLREAKALVKQIDGHRGEVRDVVFSQDGQRLFTVGEDNSAIIWDPETGRQIRTLLGHAGPITHIEESPDRRQLLTSSEDNTARVWDAHTGQALLSLEGHTDRLITAIYSPDGETIATLSHDGTVRLWNPKRRPHIRIAAHNDWVRSAVFSPVAGQYYVLSSSADGTGRIWDLQSGLLRQELRGHSQWVNSAVYSRDGKNIVTASMDGTARVWSAESGRLLTTLTGHTDWIRYAEFSPNGEMIVTAGKDKTARIFSGAQWQKSTPLLGHEGAVTSAVFSADGREVLTASEDQTARRFRVPDGGEIGRLDGHGDWVRHAVYSHDGKHILTASRDRTAVVWDLVPVGNAPNLGTPLWNEQRALTLRGHIGWVRHAVYSLSDTRILTAGADMTARLWDARLGTQLLVLTGHNGPVSTAEFSPDGNYAVTAGRDGMVLIHALDPGILRRYGCSILRSLYNHPDAPKEEVDPLLSRCP